MMRSYYTRSKGYFGFRCVRWGKDSNTATVHCRSVLNGEYTRFFVPLKMVRCIKKWDRSRSLSLRTVLPELTAEQREMMLTGMNEEHHAEAQRGRKAM